MLPVKTCLDAPCTVFSHQVVRGLCFPGEEWHGAACKPVRCRSGEIADIAAPHLCARCANRATSAKMAADMPGTDFSRQTMPHLPWPADGPPWAVSQAPECRRGTAPLRAATGYCHTNTRPLRLFCLKNSMFLDHTEMNDNHWHPFVLAGRGMTLGGLLAPSLLFYLKLAIATPWRCAGLPRYHGMRNDPAATRRRQL